LKGWIHRKGKDFSLFHCVYTGSGANPGSYTMGIRGPIWGEKAAVVRSWSLTSISVEVKNAWNYTSTPLHIFMVQCFIMHRDILSWCGT